MTHTEVVAKVLRMVDRSTDALLIPFRVRMGANAYVTCNPRQLHQRVAVVTYLTLDILADAQLAPNEVVLDIEDRTGGFDEDLLNILAKKVERFMTNPRTAADGDGDGPPTCRGNRPAYGGNS